MNLIWSLYVRELYVSIRCSIHFNLLSFAVLFLNKTFLLLFFYFNFSIWIRHLVWTHNIDTWRFASQVSIMYHRCRLRRRRHVDGNIDFFFVPWNRKQMLWLMSLFVFLAIILGDHDPMNCCRRRCRRRLFVNSHQLIGICMQCFYHEARTHYVSVSISTLIFTCTGTGDQHFTESQCRVSILPKTKTNVRTMTVHKCMAVYVDWKVQTCQLYEN